MAMMELREGERLEQLNKNKKAGIKEHNAIKLKPVDAMKKAWNSMIMTIAAKPQEKIAVTKANLDVINDKINDKKAEIVSIKNSTTDIENKYQDIMNRAAERKLPEESIQKLADSKEEEIAPLKVAFEVAAIDINNLRAEREKAKSLLSKYKAKVFKAEAKATYKKLGVKENTKAIAERVNDRALPKNYVRFFLNRIIHGDDRESYPEDLKAAYDQVKSNPTGWELWIHGNVPERWSDELKEKYGYDKDGVKKPVPVADTKKEDLAPVDIKPIIIESNKAEENARAREVKAAMNDETSGIKEVNKQEIEPIQNNLNTNSVIAKAQEAAKKVANYDRLSSDFEK
jgi:hypothetical protein